MPIGEPCGVDNFRYTVEGLPETITAVTVPVSDVASSVRFYSNMLKMSVVSQSEKDAVMGFGDAFIILKKSQTVGIDTGIYLGVHDPFEFHRRMVDDGVVFIRHPERGQLGVYASFRDSDANVLHAVEKKDASKCSDPKA